MGTRRLLVASGACFLSAALGAAFLPSFIFTESRLLHIGIPVVSLGLFSFFMFTFRSVLTRGFGFEKANLPITLLMAGFAGLVASSVLDEISISLVRIATGLVVTSSVVVGISSVWLGVQLVRIRGELGILGIVFCALLVLEGLFFASIVWISAGIVLAVFSDLVLGLILLRFAMRMPAPAV